MATDLKTLCNPSLCDPEKYDRIWKGVCEKEMASWGPLGPSRPAPPTPGVPQTPGEPVLISGILRRPELNGLQGKIIDESEDAFGRVVVRLCPQGGPPRRMRITRARLQPVRSTSTSALPQLQEDDVGGLALAAVPGTASSCRSKRTDMSGASRLPIARSFTGTLHTQTGRMKPVQSMPSLLTRSPTDGLPGFVPEAESSQEGYVSPGCRKGYFRKDNGGFYTKIN